MSQATGNLVNMADDELKTLVREFRTSVSADLDAQHRRLDDFSDEVRQRFSTVETAIVNEIRDMSGRIDRRLERVESRIGDLEDRSNGNS